MGAKKSMFFSVTLLSGKVVNAVSPQSRLKLETVLTSLDRERFAGMHPCLTLSLRCDVAPPQNVEFENMVKFGDFHPSEATRYSAKQTFARKNTPWAHCCTPNLVPIDE